MASDWIKMRTDLYRDPKVSVIADSLLAADGELAAYVSQHMQRDMTVTRNVMRNVTVGALVSVWGVMRQRGKRRGDDLVCDSVTVHVLDDISDLLGFGDAMASAGWVIETEEGIEFPRFFEDYNVDPEEKAKTKNAERQRRFREKQKAISEPESNVTDNVTVTHREEKRREEKKEKETTPASRVPPAVAGQRATKKCPESFVVTDEMRDWARDNVPLVSVDAETDKFRDYTFASARSDWPGTWRNWLRKAAERRAPAAAKSFRERDLEAARDEASRWTGGRLGSRRQDIDTIDMEPTHGALTAID